MCASALKTITESTAMSRLTPVVLHPVLTVQPAPSQQVDQTTPAPVPEVFLAKIAMLM